MRSKGSRFILGVWGLRVSSFDVAQPSQPFANVRNRSQPFTRSPHGRAHSSAKWTFGGFICGVTSFRAASVALRDIQAYFITCRKSFCVADAILLRRFLKISCNFRGRRSTLDVSMVILPGRCSTLDVSRCFFGESHCRGCVKRQQGAYSVAGIAFCEMC